MDKNIIKNPFSSGLIDEAVWMSTSLDALDENSEDIPPTPIEQDFAAKKSYSDYSWRKKTCWKIKSVQFPENTTSAVYLDTPTPDVVDCFGRKPAQVTLKCVGCEEEFPYTENFVHFRYGNGSNKIFKHLEQDGKKIGPMICAKCRPKFISCKLCDGLFKEEDLVLKHCQNCAQGAHRHYIRNYSFKVESNLKFRGENIDKDDLFYGIELEFESENLGLDSLVVNSLLGDEDNPESLIGVLKKDSSIEQGFEIVSVPATIDEHQNMWNVFFEKLPISCKPLSTCGMHVHVSRMHMTELQIGKILVFLSSEANREFITLCAGRESSFHNDFSQPKSFKDGRAKGADRHTALNLNNENTIEFRIFASTRDKRIFLKNIEFCKAIVKFSEAGARSMKEAPDFRLFIDFVFKYRKEYEYLALFFETTSLQRLRNNA